jgi:hypothetical protein
MTAPSTWGTTTFSIPTTRSGSSSKRARRHTIRNGFFLPLTARAATDAFDSTGKLVKPKTRAINKIGHALHTLSPPFARISVTPRNRAIAHSLGFRDPNVLQSMVICKQPEIGGAVPSHQVSADWAAEFPHKPANVPFRIRHFCIPILPAR